MFQHYIRVTLLVSDFQSLSTAPVKNNACGIGNWKQTWFLHTILRCNDPRYWEINTILRKSVDQDQTAAIRSGGGEGALDIKRSGRECYGVCVCVGHSIDIKRGRGCYQEPGIPTTFQTCKTCFKPLSILLQLWV